MEKKKKETGENKRASYITFLDIQVSHLQSPQPRSLPWTQASDKKHKPPSSAEEAISPQFFAGERLVHQGVALSLPFLPPEPGDDPTAAVSIPRSGQPHSPGRQAGRQGWEKTPGPSHLVTPSATSAILTYNNYHDDGADSSQHDHHLRRHRQSVSPWTQEGRNQDERWEGTHRPPLPIGSQPQK